MNRNEGLSLPEELELFKLAVAGDQNAKSRLLLSTVKELRGNLRKLHFYGKPLREWSSFPGMGLSCEDLEQEAFEVLSRRWRRWKARNGASFKTWAYRVFRNTLLQRLRKMYQEEVKGPKVSECGELDKGVPAWTDSKQPPDGLIAHEERQQLAGYLSRLNAQQRDIIMLRFGLGAREHTMEEVGELLGLSYEVVKSRQHRALERLRQLAGGRRPANRNCRLVRQASRRKRKADA